MLHCNKTRISNLLNKKFETGLHNRSYCHFFEGYTEYKAKKSNGNGTLIKRVYTAPYYSCNLKIPTQILLRISYLFLFLGAVTLFIKAGLSPLRSNCSKFVTIFEAFSFVFLTRLSFSVFSYLTAKRYMVIRQYRASTLAITKRSLMAASWLGINALVVLGYSILFDMSAIGDELFSVFHLLLAACLLILIHIIEEKVSYLEIDNPAKVVRKSIGEYTIT